MKKYIPNTITCLNLLCGSLAVVAAFQGTQITCWGLAGYQLAALFVALAAVADFLDGFAARLLHAVSPIGKELDSLSDLVSFGLAPAMMLLNLVREARPEMAWVGLTALFIAIMGALRLARFNVDTRQSTTFIGLPIPANALFWLGFCDFYASHHTLSLLAVVAVVVIVALLMVSNLRMFSLKVHSLRVAENWPQYVLVVATVAFVAWLGVPGFAAAIILYVLLSLLLSIRNSERV